MSEADERPPAVESVARQVLASVDAPAVVCDTDGRVQAWNAALADRAGAIDRLGGVAVDSVLDFGEADPIERATESGDEVVASAVLGDGREDPRRVRVRPLRVEGRVASVVAVVTDRSGDTDRSEDEHTADWSVHEAAVDAVSQALFVVDDEHTIRVFEGDEVTPGGVDAEAVVGDDITRFREEGIVGEEGLADLRGAIDSVLAGETERTTLTVELALGGRSVFVEDCVIPIERDGQIVGAANVVRDVDDRERQRRELAERRDQIATVLENLPVAMIAFDTDGRIDYYQGSGLSCLDASPDDVVGTPLSAFESTFPDAAARCRRALDGEETEGTVTIGERTLKMFYEPLTDDGAVTGALALGIDITARLERERELRTIVESSPDPIAMKDAENRYRVVNESAVAVAGLPRDEIVGQTPTEVFGDDPGAMFETHTESVLESQAVETFEEPVELDGVDRCFRTTRAPFYGPDGDLQGTVSIAREVTERRRQREQLERLTEIQQLVHENIAALTTATTEDEIKRTVCERLADSPFYEFAWIGERDPSTNEIVPICSAGDDDGYLSEITVTADPESYGQGPGGQAYRTGGVAVTRDVRTDPAFEPWREAALERGFESVASVPLINGATVHGKLGVYADSPDAFGDREVAGFEVLGEVVGFALSAARSRRLLESESGTELEFEIGDEGLAFAAASTDADCRFVFDHPVQTGDGETRCYLTVDGADPSVGATIADGTETVESCRALDAGADGPHFELVVTESVYDCLAEAGVRGKRIVVEDGVATLLVEGPGDVDTRTVHETLASRFDDVDLAAKREGESGYSIGKDTGTIEERLTDRQRTILRSAYYSGYYEWPRETDAESLAESFDVASTTLLQHLRKGHGEIMAAVFDD